MNQKNNIFYQPKLQLDQNYKSDANFKDQKAYANTSLEKESQTFSKLKLEIEKAKKSILFVPDPITKILNTTLLTVEFILILSKNPRDDKDPSDNKDPQNPDDNPITNGNDSGYIIVTEPDESEFEDEIPNSFFNTQFKSKKLETEHLTPVDKLNRRYYRGIYSVSKTYLNKINDLLSEYNTQVISNIPIDKIDEVLKKPYTLNYDELTEKLSVDYGHLSDFLIKTQKVRNQKERLLAKLFSEEKSITIIKRCETSKALLQRYYSESKVDKYLYDTILMEQIKGEEQRLEHNINQLYRYLNSSICLTKDCLNFYLKEGVLKYALSKEIEKKELKNKGANE